MGIWKFDHSYRELPAIFYRDAQLESVPSPQIVIFNEALGRELGLSLEDWPERQRALELSGSICPEGARPLAQAYAGHQFGHFTMLGDGRAILLGEMITPSGRRFDIQLKGPGRTAFSRGGDGRAALGPMLREYLMSEAMAGLGVPTNRALAVVATGAPVYREKPLDGAVLTRVASSHLRVGTFEYAAAFGQTSDLKALVDYALRRHFPEGAMAPNPALSLLKAVAQVQGRLLALWQHVSFVHGVMNTDNMSISGETIDYGPCAFMDTYSADTVFSSIDSGGRYAYGRQPEIALWNLERLAVSLLPVLSENKEEAKELAQNGLEAFAEAFRHHWREGMRNRLGLLRTSDGDEDLMMEWIILLGRYSADHVLSMRALCHLVSSAPSALKGPFVSQRSFFEESDVVVWVARWKSRLAAEGTGHEDLKRVMMRSSPAIIPRNHLVEAMLSHATSGDLEPLHQFLKVFEDPYSEAAEESAWAYAPPEGLHPHRTTCGT